MKKMVKEQLNEKINEGFQEDLNNWMEKNDINIDDKDQRENVYALCKVIYDLEKKLSNQISSDFIHRYNKG
jgi:hypothetical protein